MLLPATVDLQYIGFIQTCFYLSLIVDNQQQMAQRFNFSLHLSLLEGVNHLINFFFQSNLLRSACCNYPLTSPDLHTSPQGLIVRLVQCSFHFHLPVTPSLFAVPAFFEMWTSHGGQDRDSKLVNSKIHRSHHYYEKRRNGIAGM